jgi:hypothetical protein
MRKISIKLGKTLSVFEKPDRLDRKNKERRKI